ncbi:Putative PAS/PAC sensor protein [Modestobacter italicus]|uniref:PAS/PAC sensor protein n=1 Tax=Modestobacter italicus (strain DSM 44449 / CECT 9708 / BC 501) TaxID=2732864 RepID=I4EYP5_MODI5|nr:Putative PAS/PAC sensor protein [Modestobacter marinus]
MTALSSGQLQLLPSGATEGGRRMVTAGPVQELVSALAPEAVAVVPLPGRTGPVGVLTVVGLLIVANGAERGGFTPEDLTTLRHVAARAGLVLDNARLYRQQRSLAEGLQRSLLTPSPEPDHAQVVVRYVPSGQAAQVGGDWYDAFLQPEGAMVLVIGDVVGHDVKAAAAMGQVRTILRAFGAEGNDGPADILRRTDAVMETLRVHSSATAAAVRLEQTPDERSRGETRVRWSNAGHPPPFVIDPDGNVAPLLGLRADMLLEVDPATRRREQELVLQRDSIVILYTDGLIERRDTDLDHGLQRLQEALGDLAGRDLDELCDELLACMLPETATTTSPSSRSGCTRRTSFAPSQPAPTWCRRTFPALPPSSPRLSDAERAHSAGDSSSDLREARTKRLDRSTAACQPVATLPSAVIRSSAVGWVASSRPDKPETVLDRPCSARSAAASSSARPWSAANRSAANSARRQAHASTSGQTTAMSAIAAITPPASQRPSCTARTTATTTPQTHTTASAHPG